MEFLKAVAEMRTPFFDRLFSILTHIGGQAVVIVLVCLIFWCINKKLAYGITIAFFSSALAVQGMKIGFRIERPWVIDPSFNIVESARDGASGYSFPSGHTQNVTSVFGTLFFTLKNGWLKLLCLLVIPTVAFSRMYLGVHTPEDVLYGFGIAAAVAIVIAIVYNSDSMTLKALCVFGALLLLGSAAVLLFTLSLHGSKTIEYDMAADCCKTVGGTVGFVAGCILESLFVKFSVKTKRIWQQAVKLVVGVGVLFGIEIGLKQIFALIAAESLAFDAIRYFFMIFWIVAVWPLIFSHIFKAEKAEQTQHEITEKKPLLDKHGVLTEPGYARSLILDYDRKAIKARKRRIKEWDYYYVGNDRFGIALTIDDNSYMGLASVSLIDFENKWEITTSPMKAFPNGKTKLPPSSVSGDVATSGKGYSLSFKNEGSRRVLSFHMDNFKDGKPIDGEVVLTCPETDSMVIATPFPGDRKAFYYNQKINCMPAEGKVVYDGKEYAFDPSDSFGTLDWGRGVWTYKNTWYWGSASGLLDGEPFGFNIGYGFGDTTAASENMLFYKNKAHKLSGVVFNIPKKGKKDDFLSPWTFTSDDGRFEMDFIPIIDRASKTDVLLICSDQHQVFGRFSGKAVLDDGTELKIENLLGFAEKVYNKW